MDLDVIILKTQKFQDRHLISDLLGRNGEKISCLFYGGAGGGVKAKTTQVVAGNSLTVTVNKKKRGELYSSSEWKTNWFHKEIQHSYKAYYLALFFLEIVNKTVAPSDEPNEDNAKYFKLLSNALYYIEQAEKENTFHAASHLSLFGVKLLYYSGVLPNYTSCQECLKEIRMSPCVFDQTDSGFVCESCMDKLDFENLSEAYAFSYSFRTILHACMGARYADYKEIDNFDLSLIKYVYNFFFKLHDMKTSNLKTYDFQFPLS